MHRKLLYLGWITSTFFLLLYSFTQVDLGLTLTQASFWQVIQKSFQYIGYFNRPLSSVLFLIIIFVLFFVYLWTLKLIKDNLLKRYDLWKIILFMTFILFFSYNAFSYDLFNYIFDAKIITYYNENPYVHKALDYPADPMLSFMHWTHRTFPYGPLWLVLTVPLSYVGLGFFLPTFYLFKALMVASFIGTIYFLEKILIKIKITDPSFAIAFFALNPLVLIESLVSSHNDIVMIFFAIFSLYFLFEKKYIVSFLVLLLSVGVKFGTLFLIPVYLYFLILKENKRFDYNFLFYLSIIFMIIPVILASLRTNFQPWYLLYMLPFSSFVSKKYFVFIPVLVLSFFSLLQYVPYLYLGNWDFPVPNILFNMSLFSVVLSFILITFIFVSKKMNAKSHGKITA